MINNRKIVDFTSTSASDIHSKKPNQPAALFVHMLVPLMLPWRANNGPRTSGCSTYWHIFIPTSIILGIKTEIQSDVVRPVGCKLSYDPHYQEAETAGKTPDRAQGLNPLQISGLRCLGTDKLPC